MEFLDGHGCIEQVQGKKKNRKRKPLTSSKVVTLIVIMIITMYIQALCSQFADFYRSKDCQ